MKLIINVLLLFCLITIAKCGWREQMTNPWTTSGHVPVASDNDITTWIYDGDYSFCGVNNPLGDYVFLYGTGGTLTIRFASTGRATAWIMLPDGSKICNSNFRSYIFNNSPRDGFGIFILGATADWTLTSTSNSVKPDFNISNVQVSYTGFVVDKLYGNVTVSWNPPIYQDPWPYHLADAPVLSFSLAGVNFPSTSSSVTFSMRKGYGGNYPFKLVVKNGVTYSIYDVSINTPATRPSAPSFNMFWCGSGSCSAGEIPKGITTSQVIYTSSDTGGLDGVDAKYYYQTSTNNITWNPAVRVTPGVETAGNWFYLPRNSTNYWVRMFMVNNIGTSNFGYAVRIYDYIPGFRLPAAPIPVNQNHFDIIFYQGYKAYISAYISIPKPATRQTLDVNDPSIIGDGNFVNYTLNFLQNNGQWSQNYTFVGTFSAVDQTVSQNIYIDNPPLLLTNPKVRVAAISDYGQGPYSILDLSIYGYPDPSIGQPYPYERTV